MAIRPVNRDTQDFTNPSSSGGVGTDEALDFIDGKGNIVASLISDADGSKSLEVDGESIEPLSALSTLPTATVINPDTDTIVAEVMTVVVAGAGTEAANGTYTYRGQYNGRAYYNLEGEASNPESTSAIAWLSTFWSMGAAEIGTAAYTSSEDVAYPWLATWEVSDGSSPAPTVTAVPVTMQVSREVLTGYKVYRALLTQSGTDDPVATVLENTLGGEVVWTRQNVGAYVGTLTGAFVENKTATAVYQNNNNGGGGNGNFVQYLIWRSNADSVFLAALDVDLAGATSPNGDSILSNTLVEILVYN